MTRTIVFDSGGLIAIERNELRILALIKAARDTGATILIPAVAVAEVWRTGSSQANLARFLKAVDAFPVLDFESAKRAGERIACVPARALAIDACVADVARHHRPALLVTSDPDDMRTLLYDVPAKSVDLNVV